jgi:hypothetical protein
MQARQEFQKEDIATTSTVQQSKEAPEYENASVIGSY